jgi:hypothetical protein
MAAYQTFETQAIYQAIHDLALWLTPHVGKWPKWIRPTLGHQVMEGVLNLFRACVSAYAAPKHQRLQYLNIASAELDGLRLLMRLCHADTYRLRTSLWNEAKGTLGEYIC